MNSTVSKREKLIIDHKKCIKCGKCVLLYPDYFFFDNNFKLNIKEENLKESIFDNLLSVCPQGAKIKR